jgi:polyisoprenoid-binding protein YceI
MKTHEAVLTKTNWGIDTMHSQIGFKVKHLMFTNVRGVFKEYNASISTLGEDLTTAEINLTINPASIDTNESKRDEHLRSPDFFHVDAFNEITFASKKFEKINDSEYILHGDLTMKDVTKPVKLSVEFGGFAKDPWGNEKAGISIQGKINRKDWGLNWNAALETGGVLVGEDVTFDIEVQLTKQA